MKKLKPYSRSLAIVVLLLVILTACSPSTGQTTIPTTASTPVPTAVPPTATPQPRALTICLGSEPDSLYIYGKRSASMWSVLEGIYDGPIDLVNYSYQPVVLEKLPSLADGDAILEKVKVGAGQIMVDADDHIRNLSKGVRYHPSGCSSADCSTTYDGNGEIELDRLVVHFKLKAGITWSDGTPLKASDSAFSYKLATQTAGYAVNELLQRTETYTALDGLTTEWKGIPGYRDQNFMTRFWTPLPEHIFSGKDPATLGETEEVSRKPIGWGPYVISEWQSGDHIRLDRNPAYFRASEGLPKLDTINYRFLDGIGQTSLETVLTGECDIVDETTLLDEQLAAIMDLQNTGKVKSFISPVNVWEGVYLGINPASYDDGYKINPDDRPDVFFDARTRQALAMCIDRSKIAAELWSGQTTIPNTYQAAGNPTTDKEISPIEYSPEKANALLDSIGWKDLDGNPATPRVAVNMNSVYTGTPMQFTYYTTNAVIRQRVLEMVTKDLSACGVVIVPQILTPEELFKTGPEGVIFGRKFDLAEFSWSASTLHPCAFYKTDQINNSANNWVGVNVSGFSDPDYDTACENAMTVLPGEEMYQENQNTVQMLFSDDLPAIPLYQRLRISVSRPDLCGYAMDATSRSSLWSIEQIDYGNKCP